MKESHQGLWSLGLFHRIGQMAAGSLDTEKVVAALEGMDKVFTPFGIGRWGGKETFGVAHQLFAPVCLSEMVGDKRDWTKTKALNPLP